MNANVQTKTITVVEGINISLTLKEALAVAVVCASVTGSYDNSFRGSLSSLGSKLDELGIKWDGLSHLVDNAKCQNFQEGDIERMAKTEQDVIARATGDLKNINDPRIDAALQLGNKIAAIKILRELSARLVDGVQVFAGLREAKEEIDRRQEQNRYNRW